MHRVAQPRGTCLLTTWVHTQNTWARTPNTQPHAVPTNIHPCVRCSLRSGKHPPPAPPPPPAVWGGAAFCRDPSSLPLSSALGPVSSSLLLGGVDCDTRFKVLSRSDPVFQLSLQPSGTFAGCLLPSQTPRPAPAVVPPGSCGSWPWAPCPSPGTALSLCGPVGCPLHSRPPVTGKRSQGCCSPGHSQTRLWSAGCGGRGRDLPSAPSCSSGVLGGCQGEEGDSSAEGEWGGEKIPFTWGMGGMERLHRGDAADREPQWACGSGQPRVPSSRVAACPRPSHLLAGFRLAFIHTGCVAHFSWLTNDLRAGLVTLMRQAGVTAPFSNMAPL